MPRPPSRSLAIVSLLLLVLAGLAWPVFGQGSTDLYLVTLETRGEDVAVSSPVRLTDRDGYDNQPAFSADDSRVYYTSMRGEQTDVFTLKLDGDRPVGEPSALFETPESEYSPTPIPGEEALSVVRVEDDGAQRLWRLPLDGEEAEVLLPAVRPVGYHAWDAAARELVLFVLDEPAHQLVRLSRADPNGTRRRVARDIGRALHRIPGEEAFSFIGKAQDGRNDGGGWRVTRLDLEGDRLSTLVPAVTGSEDVAWSADGSLWTGDGSRLLRWRRGEEDWREVADLGRHGVFGITRLAFDSDGDRLVLVAERAPEKVRELEIVERSIAHHGGERYTSSDTSLRLCSRSGCFDVRASLGGDEPLFEVGGERRGQAQRVRLAGQDVSLWRGGEPVAVSPEDAQGLRDWVMARVYFPFLPYRLEDPSVWKQDLGVESWDGRELRKVRVTFDAGSSTDADDVYLYWFDEETAEMVQFAYSYRGSPGGLRFRVLENPRRVGGLLFFDQKNYGVEGEGLSVLRLTPASVRDLRLVSTVTVEDVAVRGLETPSP